jgi:hypothetical protein
MDASPMKRCIISAVTDPYSPPATLPPVRQAEPIPRRQLVISTIILVVVTAGMIVLLLVVFLPRLRIVFGEVDIQLPRLTQWVLDPWFHLVLGGLLLGLIAWRYRQSWHRWLTHAVAIVFALYLVITLTGLFLPVMTLIEKLKNGG